MKALSIRQPWAWLIANGIKDVENRTWSTGYRGPLLIHAGSKIDTEGLTWLREERPEVYRQLPLTLSRGGGGRPGGPGRGGTVPLLPLVLRAGRPRHGGGGADVLAPRGRVSRPVQPGGAHRTGVSRTDAIYQPSAPEGAEVEGQLMADSGDARRKGGKVPTLFERALLALVGKNTTLGRRTRKGGTGAKHRRSVRIKGEHGRRRRFFTRSIVRSSHLGSRRYGNIPRGVASKRAVH